MYCLACDREGRLFWTSADVGGFGVMSNHYATEHADIDIDRLANFDIVTIWPRRLRGNSEGGA